jgi:hypothetical protein
MTSLRDRNVITVFPGYGYPVGNSRDLEGPS